MTNANTNTGTNTNTATNTSNGESADAPLVAILCGSPADGDHAEAIAKAVGELGVAAEIRIGSAHRTPLHALDILRTYDSRPGPTVLITVAGRSNALSGFADPQVTVPVIACPPVTEANVAVDVWSSLRMPAGVAPVVVLEPANAAIAAVKMLALARPALRDAVAATQARARDRVTAADRSRTGAHA